MGSFEHLRIMGGPYVHGHKKRSVVARDAASCKTGGFYLAPTAGQSVNALQPLTIKWDTTCLSGTSNIDIYVKAPGSSDPYLHKYEAVPYSSGQYQADLMPRWWNATSSQSLTLAILASGKPLYMNDLPAGPQFTATYTKPSDGSTPIAADITKPDNPVTTYGVAVSDAASNAKKGLSPGKTAAAVLLPLLFVIALVVLGYFKMIRQRQKDKSQEYTTSMDKRMSTISNDWKSMTRAGANAAVRASMYQQENGSRFSTFSYNNQPRPESSVNADAYGQAGVGARGMVYQHPNGSINNYDYIKGYGATHQPRQLSQSSNVMRPSFTQSRVSFAESTNSPPSHLRTSRVSFAEGTRQSRVSFADGTRPSIDSRRSLYSTQTHPGERGSRAYHSSFNVTDDAPPVPDLVMSPSQTRGALTLSTEDITTNAASMAKQEIGEDEELSPALAMMRSNDTELLFSADPKTPTTPGMPVPPTPTYSPALVTGGSNSGTGYFAASQQSALSSQPTAISPLGPMPMLQSSISPSALSAPGVEGGGQGKWMSPDEMLRAYAEAKSKGGQTTNNNGMRQLYGGGPASPATPTSATPMIRQASMSVQGRGMGAGQAKGWSEDAGDVDAYGGI